MRLKVAPDDSQEEWVKKLYYGGQRPPLFDPANRPPPPPDDPPLPRPEQRTGSVANIIRTLSLRPDAGHHVMAAVDAAHFDFDGHLPQAVKQMIATYTSALRSCVY